MLSESGIIQKLQTMFPEQIGDDAACMPFSQKQNYLISKDLLVEDTHFRLSYQDAKSLAHKALHVNLSDLAAMGAKPQYVLLGLSIPPHFQEQADAFLDAFANSCQKASVLLIGGDTTSSSEQLLISVTAIGIANKKHIKFRSHAKPGDFICISGNIGEAHLGFSALEQTKMCDSRYLDAFLTPNARLKEGLWLGQEDAVTSMIDTSDGLIVDLERLCEACTLKAELHLEQFSPNTQFTTTCETLGLKPIEAQLTGGEDYALLFSVSQKAYPSLAERFEAHFGYPLTHIGVLREGQGITLLNHNTPTTLNLRSFSHFK